MTPDTELGSNEAVKAPYARPPRGAPRPKCGEDPNAVSPLPPRSLRHMTSSGAGSTRSYSTTAGSTSEEKKETQNGTLIEEADRQPQGGEHYNKVRVESLKTKLFEVNRRVAASPTGVGRERIVERVLVEDKLGALAARMDFLASETLAKLHESSTNSGSAEVSPVTTPAVVDRLLELLPIDPATITLPVDPPVQLKQYARYLQVAAQHTFAAQHASLSLPAPVRIAIGEETETPSPNARSLDTALDETKGLQWRMLMIKRGMQRVALAGSATPHQLFPASQPLRAAMRSLSNARACLESLEEEGPKAEDATALLDLMEKTVEGSSMLEMRREVERRLEAGTAWNGVQEELEKQVKGGINPRCPSLTKLHRFVRKMEESLSPARPKQDDENSGINSIRWRRKQSARVAGIARTAQTYMQAVHSALEALEALHPTDAERNKLIQETRYAMNLERLKSLERGCMSVLAVTKTFEPWVEVIKVQLGEVEHIVAQLRNADGYLRSYRKLSYDDTDAGNQELWALLLSAKKQLYIMYDALWRLSRRLKQDVASLQGAKMKTDELSRSPESLSHN